jgi:hypothetical protein
VILTERYLKDLNLRTVLQEVVRRAREVRGTVVQEETVVQETVVQETVVQETAVLEEAFVRRVHEVRETVCLRETVVLEEAFARRAREVREIVVQTIRDPTLRVRCKHQSMGGVIRRASPQQPCHRPLCLEHLLMLKASLWTITTLRWQHDKIAMTI